MRNINLARVVRKQVLNSRAAMLLIFKKWFLKDDRAMIYNLNGLDHFSRRQSKVNEKIGET